MNLINTNKIDIDYITIKSVKIKKTVNKFSKIQIQNVESNSFNRWNNTNDFLKNFFSAKNEIWLYFFFKNRLINVKNIFVVVDRRSKNKLLILILL